MRTILILAGLAAAGAPIAMSLPEALPPDPTSVVSAGGALKSAFQGGDVSLEFDEPIAQALIFPVQGSGTIRELRCDDAWASAWVAREPECALVVRGEVPVGADSPAYLCIRVEPTGFEEGEVGVCRASTSAGPWVLTYTATAP